MTPLLYYAKVCRTPAVADSVFYDGRWWRVTGHCKRIEDDLEARREAADRWRKHGFRADDPDGSMRDHINYICDEATERERIHLRNRGMRCGRRYRYQWCRRDEATHVELAGVCGAIALIGDVVSHGSVNWDLETIAREQESALLFCGRMTDWQWGDE